MKGVFGEVYGYTSVFPQIGGVVRMKLFTFLFMGVFSYTFPRPQISPSGADGVRAEALKPGEKRGGEERRKGE